MSKTKFTSIIFLRKGEHFIMKEYSKRLSPKAYGLLHLVFYVSSYIEEKVKELEGKGIPCKPIRTDTFNREKMTFFQIQMGCRLK